jgi:peptidyl-prolyl cis-trans isomerase SurA
MQVKDLSEPYETTDHNHKLCYKLLYLKSRTEPHRANLKQDYRLLQNMALAQKNNEVMKAWYEEKKQSTYIRRDPVYSNCDTPGQLSSQK